MVAKNKSKKMQSKKVQANQLNGTSHQRLSIELNPMRCIFISTVMKNGTLLLVEF